MRKYPKYKASGVDWLGEIPIDWQCMKIKRLTVVKRGASPRPIDDPKYFDENGEFAWVRIADVTASERYLENTTQRLSKLGSSLSVKRYPGDLFLSIAATVGKPIIAKVKCCIHDGFVWFPYLKTNPEFFYYLFSTGLPYQGLGKMGTQLNLNTDTVGDINLPIPKDEVISSIVRFLDYKAGQIDSFIANRQKQIELLKEQKQYVLDRRITEGIYPEKGFQKVVHPYIKQIPVGWEFKKLAFLSKITRLAGYEYTLLWEPQEDGEVIALRGQNVGFNELKDIENAERISKELSLRLNRSKLYKGDIVFPCVGTVGKAVLIEEDNKYHINQNIAKITPKNEVDGLFLSLLLNSYYAYHQIIHFNTSDAQPNVLVRDLRRFIIPTPPYEEQKEIARVIIKELNTLNTIISKYQKQIDLMQEYRTSLISQAVTGKIDVREWQPKKHAIN